MALKTVKVPAELEPHFARAEAYVSEYFSQKAWDPGRGTITIGGERYILMRAASMSVSFLEFIKTLYPGLEPEDAFDAAASILFDIAHAIGKADARAFHEAMEVTDPIAMLSSGPVHFAHTGWAFVDILPDSRPAQDESCYLVYDHPGSFEADSWIASGQKPARSVCAMNAGYSSGWCGESFKVELTAREILCRANDQPHCRFIMSHPSCLDERIAAYRSMHPELWAG